MSLFFLCAACDRPAGEIVMRFCKPCGRSYLAGYACDCGHEDIDSVGREAGHQLEAESRHPAGAS